MSLVKSIFLSITALVMLTSCTESNKPGQVEATASDGNSHGELAVSEDKSSIKWFKGSVKEAFQLAETSKKPLFLYWGAVWCPPCQEIKSTVFKSNQFIAQSEMFIPVYLDGDTEQAQSWGEHFGVKGYPTMIIFNSQGTEVTRIPGGIDVSRYATVLELSLNSMRPTAMLVDLAINDPQKLQPTDFTQPAYYSWQQDYNALPEDQDSSLFKSISAMAKDINPEASARLYVHYLSTLAEERSKTEASAKDSETETPEGEAVRVEMPEAIARVAAILTSDELTLACWDYLSYDSEAIVSLITVPGEKRDKLIEKWQEKTLSTRRDKSLSTSEQLAAWLPTLQLFWLTAPDGEIGPDLLIKLHADIKHADKITRSAYARQSVVSQINYLLQTAHMESEAEAVLLAELEKSKSPYYFMASLAGLYEEQEKFDLALDWRKQAYEKSTGAATRFQWGASYVRSILRMKPEEHELILTTSIRLFDELSSSKEVFAGRNFRILRSLNKKLIEWQQEQSGEPFLTAFQDRIKSLCAEQKAPGIELNNCTELTQSLN